MNASCEGGRYRIVFDDGGMNLLATSALDALDRILDAVPVSARVLTFESGRERLFAAGADMNEMSGFDAEQALGFSGVRGPGSGVRGAKVIRIVNVELLYPGPLTPDP